MKHLWLYTLQFAAIKINYKNYDTTMRKQKKE